MEEESLSEEFLSKVIIGDAGVEAPPQDDIIVSIVNSGADVDKLAYLHDDALQTGVPYGLGVDYGRIIEEVNVAFVEDKEAFESKRSRWHVVFPESALSAL
ncbi:MAG: hypothetical protein Q8O70_03895, partial [Burkholderiales bacterium]|nr:hypothetical protein [Burkholderiales bacterium]